MAAHRYWRLLFTTPGTGNPNYLMIGEIALRTAPGGPNVATSATLTADAEGSLDVYYPAQQAFDADPATAWAPAWPASWPQWLQAAAIPDAEVLEYTVTAPSMYGGGGFAPQAWQLQWADDEPELTWHTVDTRTGLSWATGETKTFTLSSPPGEHRFWRLLITSGGADDPDWCAIGEWALRETVGGATIALGGYIASSVSDGRANAYGAVDGTLDRLWTTDDSGTAPFPHWWLAEFASPVDIDEYAISAPGESWEPSSADYVPTEWQLQYADDANGPWHAIHAVSNASWSHAQTRTYTLSGGGGGGGGGGGEPPQPIEREFRLPLWQRVLPSDVSASTSQSIACRVRIAGTDVTARLIQAIDIDREAGMAAIASVTLLPTPGPIDLAQYNSAPIEVYLDVGRGMTRVFSGTVSDARYDPPRRLIALDATDDLQSHVDALTDEQIDALTGAQWVPAVSGDRHGYERAREAMLALTADLDRAIDGTLRVTPWTASTPVWTFGAGDIIDESLALETAPWRDQINRVTTTVQVRHSRRMHRQRDYSWQFNMEDYLHLHASLPDEDMVANAATANGWQIVSAQYTQRMPSGVYDGILWLFNPAAEQHPWTIIGATLQLAYRWVQTVTESYEITVECPASIERFGANAAQDSLSVSSGATNTSWESDKIAAQTGGIGGVDDLTGSGISPHGDRYFDGIEQAERNAVLSLAIARARTRILAAHRSGSVQCAVPLLPEADLTDTVRIGTDGLVAQGRLRRVRHHVESSGPSTTTLTLAVSQSASVAQVDDVLTPPAAPPEFGPAPVTPPLGGGVTTHLGGYDGAPEEVRAAPYMAPQDDPTWTGYVSNRQPPWHDSVVFDERFAIDVGEVDRNPVEAIASATYRVAVPHDTLEITA